MDQSIGYERSINKTSELVRGRRQLFDFSGGLIRAANRATQLGMRVGVCAYL